MILEFVNSKPPIKAVGIATIKPYKNTSAILRLKVFVIILGLGCGGNNACIVKTPILAGKARYIFSNLSSLATANIIGITNINATSKNNEKLIHMPAINKPSWILLIPNMLIIFFAVISTAPNSSKTFPNIAPNPKINDKWPKREPVPFSMESINILGDKPKNNPRIIATINIDRKGSKFNLVIKNIKVLIPKKTKNSL